MAAVMDAFDSGGGRTEVLPALLAQACVKVLPVAGAGISFTDELRIPLGASDPTAVRAERLQTTLGEGPCLLATATATPLRATGQLMATRWPLFHRELLHQTPYRAIASIPLQSREQERFGALDLYLTDEDGFSEFALQEVVTEIGDPIAALLFDAPTGNFLHGQGLPDWLASDGVMDRMTVWIAMGMLMEESALTNSEALATLRGYAFTHDTTLDALARQIVQHEVTVASLLGE
jgi:hypothetical protein